VEQPYSASRLQRGVLERRPETATCDQRRIPHRCLSRQIFPLNCDIGRNEHMPAIQQRKFGSHPVLSISTLIWERRRIQEKFIIVRSDVIYVLLNYDPH